MNRYKTKIVVPVIALLAAMSSNAYAEANCDVVYSNTASMLESSAQEFSEAGVGTAVVGVGFGLSSTAAVKNKKVRAVEKALRLIYDAHSGDGIVLREFARDTGLTIKDAADLIVVSDQNYSLCTHGTVLSYPQIVRLVRAGK